VLLDDSAPVIHFIVNITELDTQPYKNKRGIKWKDSVCDNSTTDVHKGMKCVAEIGRRPFQDQDQCLAVQCFISQIEQCNDAFTEADRFRLLTINIKCFGMVR